MLYNGKCESKTKVIDICRKMRFDDKSIKNKDLAKNFKLVLTYLNKGKKLPKP